MSKKVTIIMVSVLAVVLAATSIISYSLANIGNESSKIEPTTNNLAAIATDYTSNIDLIIENSNENITFDIVEIVPSTISNSTVSSYVSSGGFKKYVIDEHSETTPKGVMKDSMITVTTVPVGVATTLNTPVTSSVANVTNLAELFAEADMIYVSSPAYKSYDETNNMSEEIFNYLKTYATESFKPVVMDYVTSSDTGANVTQSKTYAELVKVISNNHIRFRTFLWGKYDKKKNTYTKSASAQTFFEGTDSYYAPFDTNVTTKPTGKILVITTDAADANGIYAAMTATTGTQTLEQRNDDIIKWAYYGNNKPDGLEYNTKAPGDVTADDINGCDFIVLENNIMTAGCNLYNELKAASEASKYILYDYDLTTTSSGSSSVEMGANYYLQLMDLLINSSGVSRYSNVLSAYYGFFDTLNSAGASGIADAKTVADILNTGDYRGNSISGANGKKFRVLELQPCYPIDLDVALSKGDMTGSMIQQQFGLKGNYYTQPSEVMKGVTEDEVEEGVEYYAFELSKAKLVYASQKYAEKYGGTALTMSQIELDQMSTEEFISKKDVVLETYDLVYIGGNKTALKPYSMSAYVLSGNLSSALDLSKVFTSFDMYTHTGQLQFLSVSASKNGNMSGDMSKPYGYVSGADKTGTMVELNGNDLTKKKADELNAYIKAGMPIIFGSDVAAAFEETYAVKDNRLKQLALHEIDPDSFMYDVLETGYTNKGVSNVKWKLDITSDASLQKVSNVDKDYGNTLTEDVTVFTEAVGEAVIQTYKDTKASRPSLVLTNRPKDYIENNKACHNEGKLSVTAYAKPSGEDTSAKIDLELYIDDNGNGEFTDADEMVASTSYTYSEDESGTPATKTLTYNDMDEDFYGLISWKVVARISGQSACTVTTGYAYYPRKEDVEKKKVRILQIMPVSSSDRKEVDDGTYSLMNDNGSFTLDSTFLNTSNTNYGENDGHSLYFCTECQMAKARAFYNVVAGGSLSQNTTGYTQATSGVNVGLHEHKFGIVKYDSSLIGVADGSDGEDWESNLADVLMDDYDFDIEIMTVDEFEKYVSYAASNTEANAAAYKKAANEIISTDGVNGMIAEMLKDDELIAAEETLKSELRAMINSGFKHTDKAYIESIIGSEDGTVEGSGEYYKFWLYNNAFSNGTNVPQSLKDAYNNYIAKYDEIVKMRQKYQMYSKKAGLADTWLKNNYDMIVLGFAEDFGGKDLSVTACDQIKSYVAKGGSMLNTHDSTTRYQNAGATKLTANLRATFGMDRFHVTDATGGGTSASVTTHSATVKIPSFDYIGDTVKESEYYVQFTAQPDNSWQWQDQKIKVSNKDVAISVDSVSADPKYTYTPVNGTEHTDNKEKVKLVFTDNTSTLEGKDVRIWSGGPYDGSKVLVASATFSSGVATVYMNQGGEKTNELSSTIAFTDENPSYEAFVSSNVAGHNATASITETASVAKEADANYQVTITVKDPRGNVVGDGISVVITKDGTSYAAKTDANGQVIFLIPAEGGTTTTADVYYRKFTTADSNLYFWTERAQIKNVVLWQEAVKKACSWGSMGVNSPVGTTDAVALYNTNERNTSPYSYVEYDFEDATFWNQGFRLAWQKVQENGKEVKKCYGTNGASRVNKGIVTTYPFTIGSELRITGTHAQTFALDMEDPEVAVWYTLSAGSTASTKKGGSLFAASPHDGMDSYFLYSKGTVNYCGAGHSVVTGPERENNDERRLFINVIVNSVRNAGSKPKITAHEKDTKGKEIDKDKTEGNLFIDNKGDYYYNVTDTSETPEFDFKVKVSSKTTLEQVYVYYDLDYGVEDDDGEVHYSNEYDADDGQHIMIAQYNTVAKDSKELAAAELAELRSHLNEDGSANEDGYKNLQLKPEYFNPYGDYTYIVIHAIDGEGKESYKRIKIKLIPYLWDLTYEGIDSYQVRLDMIDRTQFNM